MLTIHLEEACRPSQTAPGEAGESPRPRSLTPWRRSAARARQHDRHARHVLHAGLMSRASSCPRYVTARSPHDVEDGSVALPGDSV